MGGGSPVDGGRLTRMACKRLRGAFRRAWWWLRQTSGDAAYEIYLRSAAPPRAPGPGISSGAPILSRQEFYLEALCRKYSGVSRCC